MNDNKDIKFLKNNKTLSNAFKYDDVTQYKNRIDPLKDYARIVGNVFTKITDLKNPIKSIKKHIKNNKLFKNPKISFYERDLKGDRKLVKGNLLSYIRYVKKSGDIMVPSFTVYFSKDKKKSLHAEFIDVNIKDRSKHKKLALKYKLENDFTNFNYHNVIQKVKKIFNNSLSGAYASMGTILHNTSAHYTLTSITRTVASIGNALSESIISGNRHYRSPEVMFNHIATIVDGLDMKKVQDTAIEFNLHLPTADEVFISLLKSSSKYWRDIKKEAIILDYLEHLTPYERAAILYHNDLYHIRKYNDKLMRTMFKRLLEFDIDNFTNEECDIVLNEADDWVYNLVVHAASDKIFGKKRDEFSLSDKQYMASFILNLTKVMLVYKNLIKTFLVTDIFPPTMAYIKDMVREAIVLSDTDSTCATYRSWVNWYFNEDRFDEKAVTTSALVMSVVTQSIDHYIKTFAANMNITYEASKALAMKNEFFWKVFVNTNVSKHYFAGIDIQEGNVYEYEDKSKKLERKGVNLIAPNAYGPMRQLGEDLQIEVIEKISAGEKLNLQHYVKRVYEAEKLLYEKINEGNPDVLKLEKIKEAKSYKKDETQSPFMHYNLWQDVFSYKYGNAPDPQYMAVKVPTILNSKKDMKDFLAKMENREMAERLSKFLVKNKKDVIKIFRLPLIIIYNNGIPEELKPIISFKRVIRDNVNHLYMFLESLNYYVKENSILLEEIDSI